ncbi:MAG: alcohol dehydrogenase catalytic domain-containing protein [Ilumatobacteraceae bacterium]
MRVERVDDPRIEAPTDAVIRVTSSGLCGSDLHLYEVLAPFMVPGDVLGHEPMGIVEAVGSAVTRISPGDRVVVPFNISCGHCFMCDHGLQSQCETTQAVDHGTGAALFGYTKLYGQVPGGQAEYLRVARRLRADRGPGRSRRRPVRVPQRRPADGLAGRQYARPLEGPFRSLVVLGLGPIGDMSARVAQHRGVERVIGVDLVPERISRARAHGVEVIDLRESKGEDLTERVLALTSGRGADAVVDAVGMEAHGSPAAHTAHRLTALMPNVIAEQVMQRAGVDRSPRSTARSTSYVAAARSRWRACTAAWPTRCRCSRCSQAGHVAHGAGERAP